MLESRTKETEKEERGWTRKKSDVFRAFVLHGNAGNYLIDKDRRLMIEISRRVAISNLNLSR